MLGLLSGRLLELMTTTAAAGEGKVVSVSYIKRLVSYCFQPCSRRRVQEAVRRVLERAVQGNYTLFKLKINTAKDKKTTQ